MWSTLKVNCELLRLSTIVSSNGPSAPVKPERLLAEPEILNYDGFGCGKSPYIATQDFKNAF
jgi:hypothetical protein